MFRFRKNQKVVEVGGVKLGGQPGELPTVLIPSIFYVGQRLVTDKKKGLFDQEKAEALINRTEEASDKTAIPFVVDIVGTTEEAFKKFIEFVTSVTDAPFQIDALSPRVRMAIVKWVGEIGLSNRAINNILSSVITSTAMILLCFSLLYMAQTRTTSNNVQNAENINEDIHRINEKLLFHFFFYNDSQKTLTVFLENYGDAERVIIDRVRLV